MSSIFSHLLRVSLVSSFTTQRTSFSQPSSSSSSSGHDHYKHGIPGIPNDGKVVLLKNSSNGAQVYLVGTVHRNKETTQTVKKVIDYVRPDIIAIELCESRGKDWLEWISEDDNLYTLYEESKRARGRLSMKVGMFIRNCLHLLRGEVIPSSSEFKVAMEEASRLGVGCFFIDQNIHVTKKQLSNLISSNQYENERVVEAYEWMKKEGVTRSAIQKVLSIEKDVFPESFKVLVEDRDKHMFKELRRFQGKIVAVVGMDHMDGIELLWKHAENGEDWKPPANQKCGLAMIWKARCQANKSQYHYCITHQVNQLLQSISHSLHITVLSTMVCTGEICRGINPINGRGLNFIVKSGYGYFCV